MIPDVTMRVSLVRHSISVDILRSARPHLPSCGGYASFEGIVRDLNDGLPVSRLEYEAYEALAYAEMERILQTVATRFGAKFLEVVHRMGVVEVGEVAVFIQVLAAHRREAFGAAEHIIDELKRSVPIWKKEHYRDGQTAWTLCQHQGPHTHDT